MMRRASRMRRRTGCSTQETRAQRALDDVASNIRRALPISRSASDCWRILLTGNLRIGSRLAARSFSAARSASAAASLTSVMRRAGGRIGGDRVWRWNRLIRREGH